MTSSLHRQKAISESLTLLDETNKPPFFHKPRISKTSTHFSSHASIGYETNTLNPYRPTSILRVGGSEPSSRRNSESKPWCNTPYKPSKIITNKKRGQNQKRVSIISHFSRRSNSTDSVRKEVLKSVFYDFGRATQKVYRRLSKSENYSGLWMKNKIFCDIVLDLFSLIPANTSVMNYTKFEKKEKFQQKSLILRILLFSPNFVSLPENQKTPYKNRPVPHRRFRH